MKLAWTIIPASLILVIGRPAVAQDLSDVCPGADAGTGALLGVLSDADARMGLPGATVVADWTIDGTPGRTEVLTSMDGSFTLCHLPLETELSVAGMVGAISGDPVAITLTDPITRRDIAVSLTGASAAADGGEKMLACIGDPDSRLRRRMEAFVQCERRWRGLETCPRENLGRVSAVAPLAPSRGGGRLRAGEPPEWLGELIEQARELGANALVNYRSSGELVEAQAALIEVDPATC